MANENSSVASSGISLLGLMGLAFVILKLCHVIDWSWWLVTVPFWGGIALVLAICLIALLVLAVKKLMWKSIL